MMPTPAEIRDIFERPFDGFPCVATAKPAPEVEPVVAMPSGRQRRHASWLATAIGCTLFGALILPGFSWAKYVLIDRPDYEQFRAFWAPFVHAKQPLTVALPNTGIVDPDSHRQLVSNRMGTGDALALAMLYQCVASLTDHRQDVTILPPEQANTPGVAVESPLCVIGGPRTSEFAFEQFARVLRVSDPGNADALQRGFCFVVSHGAENAFVRVRKPGAGGALPPVGIADVNTGETCAVDLQDQAEFVDAALVIRGDLDDGRPVVVVAGYEQHATMKAMQALTQPGEVVTALNRAYKAGGPAQIVLRVDSTRDRAEIFKFPKAENPKSGR